METAPTIEVLWDGGVLVAVNKPPGMVTQAPPGIDSLESRLRKQFAQRSDYVALPHRLDRVVAGVILVAFSKKAARLLGEQFAARQIEKEYLAWVEGVVAEIESPWIDWLKKIPDQAQVTEASPDEDGAKVARTRAEVLSRDLERQQMLLKLFPETGRMHQLRFQASRRGYPIIGDIRYGAASRGSGNQFGVDWSKEAIALQASAIRFRDPRTARIVEVKVSHPLSDAVPTR